MVPCSVGSLRKVGCVQSSQPNATADRRLAVDACHPDARRSSGQQTANTACTCNGGFWGTGYECALDDCDANAEAQRTDRRVTAGACTLPLLRVG